MGVLRRTLAEPLLKPNNASCRPAPASSGPILTSSTYRSPPSQSYRPPVVLICHASLCISPPIVLSPSPLPGVPPPSSRAMKPTVGTRKPYSGQSRSLVLALDVGTTFSGVSYAILEPGEVPKIHGVTRCVAFISQGSLNSSSLQIPWSRTCRWQFQDTVHHVL